MAQVRIHRFRLFLLLLICLGHDPSRAVSLRLEAMDSAPGGLSTISAILDPEGDSVAGLAATMRFDRGALVLVRKEDETPDCDVARDVEKEGRFVYLPDLCSGDCNEVRAIVLSFVDTNAIRGGTLFSCNIRVSPQTEPGDYLFELVDAEATDALANLLPVSRIDGTLTIRRPPGATEIPTPSPSPTADTPTPANTSEGTPTSFRVEDDGCVVQRRPRPSCVAWLPWIACLALLNRGRHQVHSQVPRRHWPR